MLRLLDASLTSASKRVSLTAMHFPLVSLPQQGYGAAQVEEFNFELFVPTVALKRFSTASFEAQEPECFPTNFLGMPIPAAIDCQTLEGVWKHQSLTKILDHLEQPDIYVDPATYASLLQRCKVAKALSDGRRVHKHIIDAGQEQRTPLSNILVHMYCNHGALEDASALFASLHERDLPTWGSMVRVHTQRGLCREAIKLFLQMLHESVMPDKLIFASILSACAGTAALAEGKQMHAYIVGSRLGSDTIAGTALVDMYSKCGCLEDALRIFNEIPKQDTALWNAMIAAYVQNGQDRDALRLFHHMQQGKVKPSYFTFINVLSACARQADLTEVKLAHTLLVANNIEINDVLRTSFINMYGDCGNLEEARNMFDASPNKRNVDLWNALIAVYAQHGQGKVALQLFDQMQWEKVLPDEATFVSILGVYVDKDALPLGKQTHGRIMASGFEPDIAVRIALVSMYSNCGSVEDAIRIFEKFTLKNTGLWNAMIAVYVQHGLCKDALQLLKRMQHEGFMPDRLTFKYSLDACVSNADIAIGKQMHTCIESCWFVSEADISTALVNMYGKCSKQEDAQRVFEQASERNIALWNAMMSMYSRSKKCKDALCLFQDMQLNALLPDEFTLVTILDACTSQEALTTGKQMHVRIIASGLESESVGRALINMYGKSERLNEVHRLFEIFSRQDAITWFSVISVCVQHGQNVQAVNYFDLMQQEAVSPDRATYVTILDACTNHADLVKGKRIHASIAGSMFELDVALGNALINLYAESECLEDARRVLDKMPERNRATFISVLSACAHRAAIVEGRRIHARIKGSMFKSDAVVGMALINMYTKCGFLEKARETFNKISERNLAVWNAMFAAYAQHGHGVDALQLFDKMREEGVMPDKSTFASLLLAIGRAGLCKEGICSFLSMDEEYGLTPDLDHYNSVINLFGREGMIAQAEELIKNMPFKPNATSWLMLLQACQNQLDVERAERFAEKVIEEDPDNSMPYIMLLNIYAAGHREDDAERVIKRMGSRSLVKQQGRSSIEVLGKVHDFLVNDQSHPKKEKIYAEVERLVRQMEAEGYSSDSKFVLHGLEEEHGCCTHSEELAVAFGLIATPPGTPLLVAKNLRMCPECHSQTKFLSKFMQRDITVRDAHCFHKMKNGVCSCAEYWEIGRAHV